MTYDDQNKKRVEEHIKFTYRQSEDISDCWGIESHNHPAKMATIVLRQLHFEKMWWPYGTNLITHVE